MSTKNTIKACAACYRNREKCQWDDNQTATSCSRCSRLGRICHPRNRKRFGRPPVVKEFSYGSTGLFALPSQSSSVGLPKPPSEAPRYARGGETYIGPGLDLGPTQHLTLLSHDKIHGAFHKQLKYVLTTEDGFFRLHRHWLISKGLSPHYQHTVRRLFSHSPLVMANAYQSILDLLSTRNLDFEGPEAASVDLARGASCLRELVRSSGTPRSAEDAAVVLMLGQVLFVYNVLIAWPCTQIIVRSSLLTAREWFPALLQDPDWDPATLASVFVDTVQCLVRREVPVMRLNLGGRLVVDRFLGISATLLPLLYDLCVCSHRAKMHIPAPALHTSANARGADDGGDNDDDDKDAKETDDDAYSAIEHRICSWKPTIPVEHQFTPAEMAAMLVQARMYRTAGLILLHRLRHPLGVADQTGKNYAQGIINDLYAFAGSIGTQGASGIGSNFLLLLVTLELPEQGYALIRALEPVRFGPQQYAQILDFVEYVRGQRDAGFHGLWLDLVKDKLGVTIP